MKNTDQEKLNEIEDLDYSIDFLHKRIIFLEKEAREKQLKLEVLYTRIDHKVSQLKELDKQLERVPRIIKWLFRIK